MKKTYLIALLVLVMAMIPLTVAAEASQSIASSTIDLTPIFQAVLAVVAGLITSKLIPWIQARTTETQRDTLMAWIRTLVYAAEQLYSTGRIKDKLDYVQKSLIDRGYKVDRDAIEAAVRELKLTDGILIPGSAIVNGKEGLNDE